MEVFHVCYFSGQSLKSTLGGQWKVTCMYLFLQHAPDKHSNMPSDGTVHELTRNVSWRDFKIQTRHTRLSIFCCAWRWNRDLVFSGLHCINSWATTSSSVPFPFNISTVDVKYVDIGKHLHIWSAPAGYAKLAWRYEPIRKILLFGQNISPLLIGSNPTANLS